MYFINLIFIRISLSEMGWISYVLCGIQGVIDKNVKLNKFKVPKNMIMTVYGDIPPSAGLSSSSALVCGSFLATLVINDVSIIYFHLLFCLFIISINDHFFRLYLF